MKNDFISILKTIEPKEQEGFKTYIHCFYGTQKVSLDVYEDIAAALTSDDALAVIRQSAVKNKNKLNAFSELKGWLFEFLALREIQNNTTEAKFLGLEALRKRGLHEVSQNKAKQLRQEMDKQNSWDTEYLYAQMRLSHINYFSTPHDKFYDSQADLQQLQGELDNFYIATKLKYSVELYSRAHILQDKYEIHLLEEILAHIQSQKAVHQIVKDVYLPMLDMAKEQSVTAYFKLKTFLMQSKGHNTPEKQAILLYLINFTAHQIRKGQKTFTEEYFDLTQFGLTTSLFTVTGNFPTESFLNIVNVGCHLKEYEWVKKFVTECAPVLLPTEKEDTERFAWARIHFEERQFDAVTTLLNTMFFKNMLLSVNARLLLIRSYYELKQPNDDLVMHCKNLYLYAYRSKTIGENLKTSIINFVNIFRQLIAKKPKKHLFKELENKKEMLICADWLHLKIEELKN